MLRCMLRLKLKPLVTMPPRKWPGVCSALDSRWAAIAPTFQPAHSEGVTHCSGVRSSIVSAMLARPAWICFQVLASSGIVVSSLLREPGKDPSPVRRAAPPRIDSIGSGQSRSVDRGLQRGDVAVARDRRATDRVDVGGAGGHSLPV